MAKTEIHNNVKLPEIKINIVATDTVGPEIRYRVEFLPNDHGESVPNIICMSPRVYVNGQEFKGNLEKTLGENSEE